MPPAVTPHSHPTQHRQRDAALQPPHPHIDSSAALVASTPPFHADLAAHAAPQLLHMPCPPLPVAFFAARRRRLLQPNVVNDTHAVTVRAHSRERCLHRLRRQSQQRVVHAQVDWDVGAGKGRRRTQIWKRSQRMKGSGRFCRKSSSTEQARVRMEKRRRWSQGGELRRHVRNVRTLFQRSQLDRQHSRMQSMRQGPGGAQAPHAASSARGTRVMRTTAAATSSLLRTRPGCPGRPPARQRLCRWQRQPRPDGPRGRCSPLQRQWDGMISATSRAPCPSSASCD